MTKDDDRDGALERWARGEAVTVEEGGDDRERTLLRLLAATRDEPVPSMSDAEADRLWSAIAARTARRKARASTIVFWAAGLAAAVVLLFLIAPGPRPGPSQVAATPRPAGRPGKEVMIRTVSNGREVLLQMWVHEN